MYKKNYNVHHMYLSTSGHDIPLDSHIPSLPGHGLERTLLWLIYLCIVPMLQVELARFTWCSVRH